MAKIVRQRNTSLKKKKPTRESTKTAKVKSRTTRNRLSESSVIDRITNMSNVENTGLKINLYGRSGTGKTTLWATFPKPILAIICSGGNRSGELKSINTPEYQKVVSSVNLHSTDELEEIANHCRSSGEFKTIVLDHVTGLQDLALKEILGLESMPVQGSWGQASQREYGQLGIVMKERLRDLMDIPQNVVIVAQEREFNVDSDSQILSPYVGTALTPTTRDWLYSACDNMFQTFIRSQVKEKKIKIGGKSKTVTQNTGEAEYCLRLGPDPVYATKTRIPRVIGGSNRPKIIVDPTFDKLKKFLS